MAIGTMGPWNLQVNPTFFHLGKLASYGQRVIFPFGLLELFLILELYFGLFQTSEPS